MSQKPRSPKDVALLTAMERVVWSIFSFSDDVEDIQDGPFPLGGPVAKVKGYSAALEQAKLHMQADPLVRFMKMVPSISEGGLRPFEVRRKATVNTGRQALDPSEGDEEFRIERRRALEEARRRPGGRR
jgi:hypothetical protein